MIGLLGGFLGGLPGGKPMDILSQILKVNSTFSVKGKFLEETFLGENCSATAFLIKKKL